MATDLDENTITAEAFRRLENTPDPRLHEIMKALTKHLHDFAREVKLTEDEWMTGIQFLTAAGHMSTGSRQELILLSDTLGLSQLVVAQSHSRPKEVSEQTVLGPFFVPGAPKYPSHGAEIARGSVGEPLHVGGAGGGRRRQAGGGGRRRGLARRRRRLLRRAGPELEARGVTPARHLPHRRGGPFQLLDHPAALLPDPHRRTGRRDDPRDQAAPRTARRTSTTASPTRGSTRW